jgi:hypothetical protein
MNLVPIENKNVSDFLWRLSDPIYYQLLIVKHKDDCPAEQFL